MGPTYTIVLDIAPPPCFYLSPQRTSLSLLSIGLAKMFVWFLVTSYRCCNIWTRLNIWRKWPFLSYFSHNENEAQVLQTLLVWHCLTFLCSISILFLLLKNYSGDFSMTLECDLPSGGPSFVASYLMHAPWSDPDLPPWQGFFLSFIPRDSLEYYGPQDERDWWQCGH